MESEDLHPQLDPAADAADANSLMAAHSIPAIPLTINEYLFSQQQNSAYSAWFLDRLAVSGVSAAAHAYGWPAILPIIRLHFEALPKGKDNKTHK